MVKEEKKGKTVKTVIKAKPVKTEKKVKSDKVKETVKRKTPVKKVIQPETENALHHAIEGLLSKKGLDIVYIDLKKIHSSICDYFIICHGTSNTHVSALADAVEDEVRNKTGLKPLNREGLANAEWILLDYFDVVIHIFQEEIREFYKLESLWADAPVIKIDSNQLPKTNTKKPVKKTIKK